MGPLDVRKYSHKDSEPRHSSRASHRSTSKKRLYSQDSSRRHSERDITPNDTSTSPNGFSKQYNKAANNFMYMQRRRDELLAKKQSLRYQDNDDLSENTAIKELNDTKQSELSQLLREGKKMKLALKE